MAYSLVSPCWGTFFGLVLSVTGNEQDTLFFLQCVIWTEGGFPACVWTRHILVTHRCSLAFHCSTRESSGKRRLCLVTLARRAHPQDDHKRVQMRWSQDYSIGRFLHILYSQRDCRCCHLYLSALELHSMMTSLIFPVMEMLNHNITRCYSFHAIFYPPPNCLDGEPFATSPSISNKEKKTVFLETPLGRFSLMYSLPFGTRLSVQFTSGMGSLQIMQPLPLAEDHFELCLACRFQQQTPNDQFKWWQTYQLHKSNRRYGIHLAYYMTQILILCPSFQQWMFFMNGNKQAFQWCKMYWKKHCFKK